MFVNGVDGCRSFISLWTLTRSSTCQHPVMLQWNNSGCCSHNFPKVNRIFWDVQWTALFVKQEKVFVPAVDLCAEMPLCSILEPRLAWPIVLTKFSNIINVICLYNIIYNKCYYSLFLLFDSMDSILTCFLGNIFKSYPHISNRYFNINNFMLYNSLHYSSWKLAKSVSQPGKPTHQLR